jgi:sugar/nucleoside kinase (ribokinase family)
MSNYLSPVKGDKYRYSRLIGTGGIGSGMVFNLDGNHTLGRNESRGGKLMPYKDYCKLHIISHYPTVLLGGGKRGFNSYPIGKVGCDDAGTELLREMNNVGMDTKGVSQIADEPTLFSVCFQYPDKSGGNITTSNSASDVVSKEDIDEFFINMPDDGASEIILSVPEVPLDPRIRILEYGRKRGSFNICSILSGEAPSFVSHGGIALVDLLAINIDEALAIIGGTEKDLTSGEIAQECANRLMKDNPDIMLIVTSGADGSYTWHEGRLEHTSAFTKSSEVVSTAGAGDALLGGVIAGLACGLRLTKGKNDEEFGSTPLNSAIELGSLVSNLKVATPDTIYHELDANMLRQACQDLNLQLSSEFMNMLHEI